MTSDSAEKRLGGRFDRITIALLLLFLWVPVVTMPISRGEALRIQEQEKREPVPFPPVAADLKVLAAFPDHFEAYLEDQMGLRQQLIRWYSLIYWKVLGISSSPNVVVGKDGWLYYDGNLKTGDPSPLEDYRGIAPLTPWELEWLRWNLADQHDWLVQHGIQSMLVLLPSKSAIHPGHLPDRYTRTGAPFWREQLHDYLRAHTRVPVLDVTPAMMVAARQVLLFYSTDTHWNDLGAYVAHQEIIESLTGWFPDLSPMPETSYERVTRTRQGGDLARMLNLSDLMREEVPQLVPRFELRGAGRAVSDHWLANVKGGTRDARQPTAYVYRDSFSDALIPFLNEYFREVEYEWGQYGTKMKGIETRKPDVVLQIVGDRILRSGLIVAPRIHRHASHERFDRAATVERRLAPDAGFGDLRPGGGCRTSLARDGLRVHAERDGARLLLPGIRDMDQVLPVIRIEIRPPAYSAIEVYGEYGSRTRAEGMQDIGLGRAPLEQGRNSIYLSLVDPRPDGALALDLGRAGEYVIYSIEVRTLPRFPVPDDGPGPDGDSGS